MKNYYNIKIENNHKMSEIEEKLKLYNTIDFINAKQYSTKKVGTSQQKIKLPLDKYKNIRNQIKKNLSPSLRQSSTLLSSQNSNTLSKDKRIVVLMNKYKTTNVNNNNCLKSKTLNNLLLQNKTVSLDKTINFKKILLKNKNETLDSTIFGNLKINEAILSKLKKSNDNLTTFSRINNFFLKRSPNKFNIKITNKNLKRQCQLKYYPKVNNISIDATKLPKTKLSKANLDDIKILNSFITNLHSKFKDSSKDKFKLLPQIKIKLNNNKPYIVLRDMSTVIHRGNSFKIKPDNNSKDASLKYFKILKGRDYSTNPSNITSSSRNNNNHIIYHTKYVNNTKNNIYCFSSIN